MASTKKSHSWESKKYSKGNILDYKPDTLVDGIGVRCSLYVSGCLFNCVGCFNKNSQMFTSGVPYTQELEDKIIKDLSKDYVEGLTLLGGEPFLNTETCLSLVKRVRETYGHTKTIWSWSGYYFEELIKGSSDKQELLSYLDVLVDGPYEIKKRDLNLAFRGSSNQRLIDVKKSINSNKAILLELSEEL